MTTQELIEQLDPYCHGLGKALLREIEALANEQAAEIERLKRQSDARDANIFHLNERVQVLTKNCWDAGLERDALQAKLSEMEAVEPVGFISPHDLQMLSEGYPRTVVMLAGAKHTEALFTAPKVAPVQVEAAWRAGWAACRDAEYVGEEAEDEAWGMSETCANADWENAAPKVAQPLTPDMFWDSDNPEQSHSSITELLNEEISYGYLEVGAEFKIQQAIRLDDVKIKVTSISDDRYDFEYEVIGGQQP